MTLLKTVFHAFHTMSGAKMAPFANYDMPIQYQGIKKEHIHVREKCGIFDVSHMGQFVLEGKDAAKVLGILTPTFFEDTPINKCVYTVLTNEMGGIKDDLIITKKSDTSFYIVVNAACKNADKQWILENIKNQEATLTELEDYSLIALQGPMAEEILQAHVAEDLSSLKKMNALFLENMTISRTGYTGSDGFEISIKTLMAEGFWNLLLENENVKPIGLGARDSLRLEAGFPLYGHDLTTETTPVEADIPWVISKEHAGYFGEDKIKNQLNNKNLTNKKRVGIRLIGKGVLREGYTVFSASHEKIGVITSGGFNPTDGKSIGQAYLNAEFAVNNTDVFVEIRGKFLPSEVCSYRFMKS